MNAKTKAVKHHNCLVSRSALWQFKESGRIVELPVKGNLVVREGDALREATLLGLGIARSKWWLFRQDIAAGTLVEVLKARRRRSEGHAQSVAHAPSPQCGPKAACLRPGLPGLKGGRLNAETAKALTDPALRACFFLFARPSAAGLAHQKAK